MYLIQKNEGYFYVNRYNLQKNLERWTTKTLDLCIPHEAQLLYLDKIVEYCKSKSIELIFINTPMYHAERFYNAEIVPIYMFFMLQS
jgi:hypothetical protein